MLIHAKSYAKLPILVFLHGRIPATSRRASLYIIFVRSQYYIAEATFAEFQILRGSRWLFSFIRQKHKAMYHYYRFN